jgi:hypothetical protein
MFSSITKGHELYNYLQAIRSLDAKTGPSTQNPSCYTIPSIEVNTSPFCAYALHEEYPANALSNHIDRTPILGISPKTVPLPNSEHNSEPRTRNSSLISSDSDSFINKSPPTLTVSQESLPSTVTEQSAIESISKEIDTLLQEVHLQVKEAIHSKQVKHQSEDSIPNLLTKPKKATKCEKLRFAALPYSYNQLYPVNPWFIGNTPPPASIIVRETERAIQVSTYSPSSLLSYFNQMFSSHLNEHVKQILTGQLSQIIDEQFDKKVSQPAYQIHTELQLPGPPSDSLRAIVTQLREEYLTMLNEVANPQNPDLNIRGSSRKILVYLTDLAQSEDDSCPARTDNKTAPVLHLTLLKSTLTDPNFRINETRLPMEHLETGKVLSRSRFSRFILSYLELYDQTLAKNHSPITSQAIQTQV